MSYRRLRIPLAGWIVVIGLWALLLWQLGANVFVLVRSVAGW
jgi:hypothetical protein